MKPSELTLELPTGLRIAARQYGSENDAECRVLALHGWLDNCGTFAPLLEQLKHVCVVAIDLPGHGQSDWKAPSAEYHYVDWIPSVADVAEALGWDRFALMGHSMGAGISALFAGTFPDRIERLVLIEGIGPYTTPVGGMLDNMRRAIEARPRHLSRSPRTMENPDAALERKLAALPHLGEAARHLVERGIRQTDDGVAFSHDPRLTGRSLLRYTEEQVLAHLAAISAPTLVVHASEGLVYPSDSGDVAARVDAIPNREVLRVEGHHHVHLTHPERVAPFIQAFLD